jgi:hypothetical protein
MERFHIGLGGWVSETGLPVRRLAEGVGNAPTSAMPILFSRQAQPAYICLPSKTG